MICGNTSDFIDHPLPKHLVSTHGACHHAWVPGPHRLNPALCGRSCLWPHQFTRTWDSLYPDPVALQASNPVLAFFRGWPASCLTLRAQHMQLCPVDQSGYVHLVRQCCMVAHPWPSGWKKEFNPRWSNYLR